MEKENFILSPHYKETHIVQLQRAIQMHLALLLSNGYQYIPDTKDTLVVNQDGVRYSDLDRQALKTPQIVTILLEIVDFFYTHQDHPSIQKIERETVSLPDNYNHSYEPSGDKKDLFSQAGMGGNIYCLSQAFTLLRSKLFERQTGLYHILFLKTCLMLEREQVPSSVILGSEYREISWMSLASRYLSSYENSEKGIHIDTEGIHNYPLLWVETQELYAELSHLEGYTQGVIHQSMKK